jgi:drug/metabolite transporter (DMT)-like permease
MALSPLVFRERFTTPKLVGFSVVVLGAVLINGSSLRGGAAPYGIACGLASAVCFAAMMMFSKKADHVAGLEKVFIEIASAAAMVGIYALAVKGVSLGAVLRIPSSDVLPIALLGISTALSNYLYLKALGAISAQNVAVLGYIEPLSAAALGAVFLGETMLPLQMAGASCIVLGAIISQLHKPVHAVSLGRAQR